MAFNYDIVQKYINGEDIEGYDIDELENNSDFMKFVFMATNDSKMYSFISDDLKKDYNFVVFLLIKFSNEAKFIDEVATYFLENTEDEKLRNGVIVHMCKILDKDENTAEFIKYRLMFKSALITELCSIAAYNEEHPNEHIGLGFMLLFDEIEDEEVLKYYACELVEEMFDFYGLNLEDELHNDFKSAEEASNAGITYMINLVSRYDSSLASYLAVRTNLLESLNKDIKRAIKSWDRYYNKEEKAKYLQMYESVHDYVEEHQSESNFDEDALMYFAAMELGITKKLEEYFDIVGKEIEDYYSSYDENYIKNELNNLSTRILINEVKKIMQKELFGYEEPNRGNGDVIDFNTGQKL